MKTKRSQAWIETVVYTLIMLTIIGIVLGVVKPSIQKKQDRTLIDQSINILNSINYKNDDILYYGPGNVGSVEIIIKKGILSINGKSETIEFTMDSEAMYSQPDQEVKSGDITILTQKKASAYTVKLKLDYSAKENIMFNGKEDNKDLNPSPTQYTLFIKYANNTESIPQIDFSLL